MSGGKTDRSCVAIIEYYPKQKKSFLTHIENKIKTDINASCDQKVLDIIHSEGPGMEYVAFDAPLKLPKCMRCQLKCPGYEVCDESEIQWLRRSYAAKNKNKKPKKSFTPYTERCAENFISTELEEVFNVSHALGSNLAPLTARAIFLNRRLGVKSLEVFPKLSLWRIGRSLGIQKSYLRNYSHPIDGAQIRQNILMKMIEEDIIFIYDQDVKMMIENNQAFNAFLVTMTAVLKFLGQVEKKPKKFPRSEGWIEIPNQSILWA